MNCRLPYYVISVSLVVGFGATALLPARLNCSSTLSTSTVCLGDPIVCSLRAPCETVNPSLKVNGKNVDATYSKYNNGTAVTVRTNYCALVSSVIAVEIASGEENCTFVATHTAGVSAQCRYPLLLQIAAPAAGTIALKGGETFRFRYLVSALSAVSSISLATFAHPAIKVLNVSASVPSDLTNGTLNAFYNLTTDTDETKQASPLFHLKNVTAGVIVEVNVTAYLRRYVRAGAKLNFDLFAAYSYSNATLVKTVRDSSYVAALPFAHDFTLKLPLHASADYTQLKWVIPTNDGDLFSSEISVNVPCVTADLSVTILVPNYYTWENMIPCIALNITDFRVTRLPYDLTLVSALCPYSSCPYGNGVTRSNINYKFAYNPLNTVLTASIGPIQYRETAAAGSNSGNCTDADIRIALAGRVDIQPSCRYNICDILREDNITVLVDFMQENTLPNWAAWAAPLMLQSQNYTNFKISIGKPEVGLFIYPSAWWGDAGDSLVLTFGVAPLQWYSVYKANVTFWIDERFVASEVAELCLYNGTAGGPFCSMVLFQHQRIHLYFEKLTYGVDYLVVTLNVTRIAQEVAPLDELYTWGETVFYSLPQGNSSSLPGILCSNATTATVWILPVNLDPWTYTIVQRRYSTVPVVAIGDRLNMTIRACVPEIFSSLILYVSIPPVAVDNATVVVIGFSLLHRTLKAGDALGGTSYISVVGATTVLFDFGPSVLVPLSGNTSDPYPEDQCFICSLETTIPNDPLLVQGSTVDYGAFVVTNNSVMTTIREITFTVVEPLLTSESTDVWSADAGDIVTLSITVYHLPNPSVSAFRLSLFVFYPDTRVVFLGARLTLSSGVSIAPNTSNGTVVFAVPELATWDVALVAMEFMLRDDVRSGEVIPFPRTLVWSSQSALFPRGRDYSASGNQMVTVTVPTLEVSVTTSSADIPPGVVQVGELVSVDGRMVLPEGISVVYVDVSLPSHEDCHIVIINASIPFTGGSLLLYGQPNIIVANTDVLFSFGTITNVYNNIADINDTVSVQINAFVSGSCSASSNMVVPVAANMSDVYVISSFKVVHPHMKGTAPLPVGDWKANDTIDVTVSLVQETQQAVAYDVIFQLECSPELLLLALGMYLGEGCPTGVGNCSVNVGTTPTPNIRCPKIINGCTLLMNITMKLSLNTSADHMLAVNLTSTSYRSSFLPPPLQGEEFGPELLLSLVKRTPAPVQSVVYFDFMLGAPYVPLLVLTPLDALGVLVNIQLPKGTTLNLTVCLQTNLSITLLPALQVELGESMDTSELRVTTSPPKVSFGDVWTHPEQEITAENLTVVVRLDVLSGSEGSNLTVSIATQYLSDEGIRTLLDTQTLPVVRPRLLTVASVSTRVVDIGNHIGLTLSLNYQAGSITPAYNVSINLTLPNTLTLINASSLWSMETLPEGQSLAVQIPDWLTPSDTAQVQISVLYVGGATLISPLLVMTTYASTRELRYHDTAMFPPIYTAHIDAFGITLVSTNDTLTDGYSLGYSETAEWDLELQYIVGPFQDLVVMVQTNASLVILSANVTYVGAGITSGTFAVTNHTKSWITVSLYVGSVVDRDVLVLENCTVRLRLWTESFGSGHGVQVAAIDATVKYGSVIKKEGVTVSLVQVPSQTLSVTFLPVQSGSLISGGQFELMFTLALLPVYDTEAHDVVVVMDLLDPFLEEAPMMMVDYRNGTIATIETALIFQDGLYLPALQTAGVLFTMPMAFLSSAPPPRTVNFTIIVDYYYKTLPLSINGTLFLSTVPSTIATITPTTTIITENTLTITTAVIPTITPATTIITENTLTITTAVIPTITPTTTIITESTLTITTAVIPTITPTTTIITESTLTITTTVIPTNTPEVLTGSIQIVNTSSPYTFGGNLTINEIFVVSIKVNLTSSGSDVMVALAASAQPLPSNPLLVLGVAQEQTGGAGSITSLHPFGSGSLVVWNITSGSNASITLSAKLVLLDLAYSGLHITFSAPVTIGNSQVMEPSVEAVVVEPSLLLHRSATTFSDSLSTRVECLLTAYHSSTSTTTAHRVYMQEAVPEGMGVIKAGYSVMGDLKGVQVLQGEGVSAVGRALLWLSLELLPLDRNVTLMYIADVLVPYQTNHTLLVNSSLKFFSIEANPASVNSNLSEYSGKMYLQTTEGCVTVMVDKVTDNRIAILFVCIISLASLCCLPCLWVLIHTRVTSTHKVAPAALTQLSSLFKRQYSRLFHRLHRPLVSSLLEAYPKRASIREGVYEEVEVDCIVGMEWDLHLLVADHMVGYAGYLITMDTKHAPSEAARLVADLQDKKLFLQNTLDVQFKRWSSDISANYNQIEEALLQKAASSQSRETTLIKELTRTDAGTLRMELDQQHNMEKGHALEAVEVKKKAELLQLKFEFLSHYQLGLQGIVLEALWNTPDSAECCGKFMTTVIKHHIPKAWKKLGEKEAAILERAKRHRAALLDKRLTEDEDSRWEAIVRMHIREVTHQTIWLGHTTERQATHLGAQNESAFLAKLATLRAEREESEEAIRMRALEKLETYAKDITIMPTSHHDLEGAIRQWHEIEQKREHALERVEHEFIDEIGQCWRQFRSKLEGLVTMINTRLSSELLSRCNPIQLSDCDAVLAEQEKAQHNLKGLLKTKRQVLRERLQLRLSEMKERISAHREAWAHTWERRTKLLEEITSDFLQSQEQSSSDKQWSLARLQRSFSLERLLIHYQTKAAMMEKANRKMDTILLWYQGEKQKTDPVDDFELFKSFLKQRRAVLDGFNGEGFDEERWRVEERYHVMGVVRKPGQAQVTLPMVAVHNRDVMGTSQLSHTPRLNTPNAVLENRQKQLQPQQQCRISASRFRELVTMCRHSQELKRMMEDHHNMLERKTNVLMEQYLERQGLKYKAVLHKWSGLTSAQISDLVTKWQTQLQDMGQSQL